MTTYSPTISSTIKLHNEQQQQQQQENICEADLYASSVSSSSDISPSPTSSPTSYTTNNNTLLVEEPLIRRPDSPRPLSHDATAVAKERLRQLVVWGDAAEETRDTISAPTRSSGREDTMEMCQQQTQKCKNAHKLNLNAMSSTNNKGCNMEFPTTPSSTASDDEEELEDIMSAAHSNNVIGRINKFEQHIASRKKSQDRIQRSPWHESESCGGMMRRKSFFNGRRRPSSSNETSVYNKQNMFWGSSNSDSNSSLNNQRYRYSTGNNIDSSSSINNSFYLSSASKLGSGSCRYSSRRPQSFHRYARITAENSNGDQNIKNSKSRTGGKKMSDEFDELIDGLHATKVTETTLQL